MWDLPRPGLKPVSPALAGRFSTTAPPGKPYTELFNKLPYSFRVAVPLYSPTSKVWVIQFLCILTNIWYHHYFLKFWNYFNRYIVIFHCGFNLCFHNSNDVEHLFMCLFAIHISSLMKYLFVSFVHFTFALVFCCWVLGILYRYSRHRPLLVIWFANIFS